MKTKRKHFTIATGLTILCLLFLSMNVSSVTNVTIKDVTHPEKVKLNSAFEVDVDFTFASDHCLHGDYIYLHYTVKTLDDVSLASGIISKPVNKQNRDQVRYTFSVDTSFMEILMEIKEIEEDVKFSFRIKYSIGAYIFGTLLYLGTHYSEYYELTITRGIFIGNLPLWAFILIVIAFIGLTTIILFWGKRR